MTPTTSTPSELGAAHGSRLRPRARWTRLPGPPYQGMSSVWEHPSGARVHMGGLLRLPDRSHASPTWGEERKFAAHQPKRRRWLLTWAESRLSVNVKTLPTEGCAAADGYAGLPARHTYSRWDYQNDRHELMRWINSKRTSKALDWRWDGQRLTIMVEYSRHRRRWYQIDSVELDLCRLGWRWLIARAIKECRLALRHTNDQTQAPAPL